MKNRVRKPPKKRKPVSLHESTPVEIQLGEENGCAIQATLYEFGGISIRISSLLQGKSQDVQAFRIDDEKKIELKVSAERALVEVVERFGETVEELEISSDVEDYSIFEVVPAKRSGAMKPGSFVAKPSDDEMKDLLGMLEERSQKLSQIRFETMRDTGFSFYESRSIIIGWNGSMILHEQLDPSSEIADVLRNIATLERVNAGLLQLRRAEDRLEEVLEEISTKEGKRHHAKDSESLEQLSLQVRELIVEVEGGLENFETEETALLFRAATERFQASRRIAVVERLLKDLEQSTEHLSDKIHQTESSRIERRIEIMIAIELIPIMIELYSFFRR